MKLIIQNIKNDVSSRNPIFINLALQCIANIGNKEMADAFAQDIPKLLVSGYAYTLFVIISHINWLEIWKQRLFF